MRIWPVAFICSLTFLQVSCIVTDKIEAEEKVNMPPDIYNLEPTHKTIAIVCQNDKLYIDLWDPNSEDAPPPAGKPAQEDTYDALIYIRANPYSPTIAETGDCIVRKNSHPDETEKTNRPGGVFVSIECELTDEIENFTPGDVLIATVLISDYGFDRNIDNKPREGARTAEIIWFLELGPKDYCEG